MQRTTRTAFTLVELLVVVGIIAVLISIALGALRSARRQANLVVCQNNLRQLIACAMTYASDNEGQLPYCNWSNGGFGDTNAYSHGWLFSTNASWDQSHPPADAIQTGVLWPYNKSPQIYHCPFDPPEGWTGSHCLTSYLMNGAQGGYGRIGYGVTKNVPGLTLHRFKQPSQSVILWEADESGATSGAPWNDGSSFPPETGLADRHYLGANVGFLDGHTEWWRVSEFTTEKSAKPGKLWCDPLTADGT